MVRIEMNPEEAGLLHEILEEYVSDLRMEIAATDSKDFREALKKKEEFLKNLLEKLRIEAN